MLFKKKILYKDWLWYWMQKKKDYIKESTYSNYSNIISNHIIPELGNIKLSNLNNKLIQEYLINKYKTGRLDGNGGLSYKTIRDIIAVVKSSLKYAIKEEMINNINLDFTYPKIGNKDKIYTMPKKDQERLITYIKQNEDTRSLGILLALYSGIRIGELCALQWKDIDFKNNILHINFKSVLNLELILSSKTLRPPWSILSLNSFSNLLVKLSNFDLNSSTTLIVSVFKLCFTSSLISLDNALLLFWTEIILLYSSLYLLINIFILLIIQNPAKAFFLSSSSSSSSSPFINFINSFIFFELSSLSLSNSCFTLIKSLCVGVTANMFLILIIELSFLFISFSNFVKVVNISENFGFLSIFIFFISSLIVDIISFFMSSFVWNLTLSLEDSASV